MRAPRQSGKGCPDNISFLHELGPREATDAAIDGAHRVVKQRFIINRIACCSMEVRSCVGHYYPDDERYVLYAGTQGPHAVRAALADEIFDVPLDKVQVISEDMGGGFGTKAGNYPEHTLCLWASRELGGKPVKWVSDRTEALLTDNQARDNVTDAELGLDENGKFLGLRVRTKANLGAYYATDRLAFPAITHIGCLVRSLHNRCDPRRSDAPAHQHQSDGTLSGSRPARSGLCSGTHGRLGRTGNGH